MVIKVYISSISGNMEIKKQQDSVIQILQSHKIELEKVDITDPSKEDDKMYMRQHSVPKDGQKIPLPPQIFNDADYCGDYEGLYDANECDEVLYFLKLTDAKPVSEVAITIAEEMNANVKGYVSGDRGAAQTESAVENGTTHAPPEATQQETTVVSTLTLGSLSARAASDEDEQKQAPCAQERAASSGGDDSDKEERDRAAVGFEYARMPDQQEVQQLDGGCDDDSPAPPISPRATRKQQRKSREFHDYENVDLSVSAEGEEARRETPGQQQKEEDELSLHDSIEDSAEHRNGDGDKEAETVEEGAEQ